MLGCKYSDGMRGVTGVRRAIASERTTAVEEKKAQKCPARRDVTCRCS